MTMLIHTAFIEELTWNWSTVKSQIIQTLLTVFSLRKGLTIANIALKMDGSLIKCSPLRRIGNASWKHAFYLFLSINYVMSQKILVNLSMCQLFAITLLNSHRVDGSIDNQTTLKTKLMFLIQESNLNRSDNTGW